MSPVVVALAALAVLLILAAVALTVLWTVLDIRITQTGGDQ